MNRKIFLLFLFFLNNNAIAVNHVFKNGRETEIRGISLEERLRELYLSHPTDDLIALIELIYSAEVNLATYCYDRNAIIYGVANCSYCNMFEIK